MISYRNSRSSLVQTSTTSAALFAPPWSRAAAGTSRRGHGRTGRSPRPAPAATGRRGTSRRRTSGSRRLPRDDRHVDVEARRSGPASRRDPAGRQGGTRGGGLGRRSRRADRRQREPRRRRRRRRGRGWAWRRRTGLGRDRHARKSAARPSRIVTPSAVSSAGSTRVRNDVGRTGHGSGIVAWAAADTPRTVRTGTLRATCGPVCRSSPASSPVSPSRPLVLGGILAFAPTPGAAATPAPAAVGLHRAGAVRRPGAAASAESVGGSASPRSALGAPRSARGAVPRRRAGTRARRARRSAAAPSTSRTCAASRSGSTSWARTARRASTSSRS